ncbi:Viral expression factor [Trabala vishnou gigantina nucleopolyhedrovirus]|uniref:Viral expression factor n=1 Tax=Trabala vishnou gigantina nucleopolyhedrovirus TaxID=2863583 RepID=UPI002481DFE4|nr:Viral expression factor [Trabala vishnou gigantina nucleopolyhedrovirus]QYC92655.1 Viral expression factor [Trabala vishnou gigantina nucleopolyhedrovirus]
MNASFSVVIEPTLLPTWTSHTETYYAVNHGRVSLGHVCNAGSVIKLKFVNTHSSILSVVLRCFTDDRRTSSEFSVTNSSLSSQVQSFTWDSEAYVPFVDRPVKSDDAAQSVVTLQVEIENYTYALPTYVHFETSENAFKNQWNATDCPFALINVINVVFLVRIVDRTLVRSLSLVDLYEFYEKIITFYDTMIGVTLNNANPVNRSYKKQFFCRPDRGGFGAAFYNNHFIGMSGDTIGTFFITDITNWLALQIISQAYNFHFVENVPELLSVWNNILANQYELSNMSYGERQQSAWLFNHGRREQVELSLVNLIGHRVNYIDSRYGYREKLWLFAMMMSTPRGPETFTRINFQYRQNRIVYNPNEIFIADWWSALSIDDFLPFMMLMQLNIVSKHINTSNNEVDEMFTFERALAAYKRVPYPAKYLMDDFNVDFNNYGLKLESNLNLLYPGNIVGSFRAVTINFVIDDIFQIAFERISIYDGDRLAFRGPIDIDGTVIANLSVGVYTVHAPRGKSRRYELNFNYDHFNWLDNDCTNLYLIVTRTTTSMNLYYKPIQTPRILSHRVGYVLGFGNRFGAKFVVNTLEKTIGVIVYRRNIHGVFPNNYLEIQLRDGITDQTLNSLIINGTRASGEFIRQISYRPGDVMHLIFADSATRNRLIFIDTKIPFVHTRYSLTDNDVVSLDSGVTLPSSDTKTRNAINDHVRFLDQFPNLLAVENAVRDQIYLMIQSLPDSADLMVRYYRYLPRYFRNDPEDDPNDDFNGGGDGGGGNSLDYAKIIVIVTLILVVLVAVISLLMFNVGGGENTGADVGLPVTMQTPPPSSLPFQIEQLPEREPPLTLNYFGDRIISV